MLRINHSATNYITINGTDLGKLEPKALILYAEEGHHLIFKISSWESMASLHSLSASNDHQMTITWIFHSAISIYLSGVYNYSPLWAHYGIAVSNLDLILIQHHESNIVDKTDTALRGEKSHRFALPFPLRIAGARVDTAQKSKRISCLLTRIQDRFQAAAAVTAGLDDL